LSFIWFLDQTISFPGFSHLNPMRSATTITIFFLAICDAWS